MTKNELRSAVIPLGADEFLRKLLFPGTGRGDEGAIAMKTGGFAEPNVRFFIRN